MLLFGACSTGAPARTPNITPRPSVRPSSTPVHVTDTPTPIDSPTEAPWTAEWQDAFCAAFEDVVIAQQVARDIGRSIAAEDPDNAAGLAHELEGSVTDLVTELAGLPAWQGSTDVVTAVTTMLQQDANLATHYLRFLEDDRAPALDRAHEVEGTLRASAIPAVSAAMGALVSQGLSCPNTALEVESP
jgi:hypothetical protein